MLGKIEGKKRRGWQGMRWLDSNTDSMNMNLSLPGSPVLHYLLECADSLEKTLTLGKIKGKRRREQQRIRQVDSITDSMDMKLSKLQEIVKDREGSLACCSSRGCKESVMLSNHLILCCSLLLLPSIFPSIMVFANESVLSYQVAKVLEFQLQHQSFQ